MNKGKMLFDRSTALLLKDGNDPSAVALMEKSLSCGYPLSAYAMATWYLHGVHYKKNIKKGTQLLKQAANLNIPQACYDLAVSYEKGIGVKKSSKKAFEHYLKAAFNGDNISFREIGRCYYYGIGTNKNKKIAGIWLAKARELGVTW